jgi:NAD(P)-dependent dehydrogenase (short-subunit alcohol dehydrogenase family)
MFEGKRILVTGSSRGIGFATAQAFLDAGAQVAVNGRTAESTAEGIDRLGGGDRLIAAPGDVATVAGCEALVASAVDALGGLDVLVNSAGIAIDVSLEDGDEAVWDSTMNINLKGTYFCIRAAAPALRESRGNIVNVGSDSSFMGMEDNSIYCASKGGVLMLARALSRELAPEVRINCVCPGFVDTDMVRRDYIDSAEDPAEILRSVEGYSPLNRMGQPEEIAAAILYLASEQAGFVTGSALSIDGGMTASY